MPSSPLLPLHARAGARLVPSGDAQRVLTYGDVPAEYRAAQTACVVFDAAERGTVHATGGDRAEFLHRILANRVRGLAPGQGNANLLLTSKGKVAHVLDLAVAEDRILLSTPASGEALRQGIDRYLFTEDVQLADASDEATPVELCGPGARAVLADVLEDPGNLAVHAWRELTRGDLSAVVTAVPVAGSPGYRLDAGAARAPALWEALTAAGARPAGLAVRDILRVEAGHAQWGADVDDNVYPQEARLEGAFDLEKGCYIGQEVVAKIDTYGGLNKRLVALKVAHDDPVPRGTPLVGADGRELGLVTSWAYSFVLDTGLCLGYAKRKHQEVGTTFRLGPDGAEAEIVAVPVRDNAVPLPG